MGPTEGEGEEGEEGGFCEESGEEGGRATGVGEDGGGEGEVYEILCCGGAVAVWF